jgi:hypothetical protein
MWLAVHELQVMGDNEPSIARGDWAQVSESDCVRAASRTEKPRTSDEGQQALVGVVARVAGSRGGGAHRIHKTDLAPVVGANLAEIASNAKKTRGERPFMMCNPKALNGLNQVVG